jgi:hypothetical protein
MTRIHDTGERDLRFWGCAIHNDIQGPARKALIEQLKAAGFKASMYGYKARIAAEGHKRRVLKATGIELEVFQHDYL